MASMEEDFPRGGAEKKTTEPKRVKTHDVDNLFENRETAVKKKKKRNVEQDEEEKTKKLKVDVENLKLNSATTVEILHLRNLNIGTLMLGCVKEVSEFEVVVGLPSGLVGYLPIYNICDSYTNMLNNRLDSEDSLEAVVPLSELLTPGMLVRCVVSSLDSAKEGNVSLKVSINPKEVNKVLSSGTLKPGMTLSGCVESVEDHGYLVDIGISGTKAFLPKKSTASKQDLNVGQYMSILIEEVKNDGRVVRLTQNPQALAKAVATIQHGWTLDAILPGLLIRGRVKRVTPHGLIVTYLSSFTGVVNFLHLDDDKASTYSQGQEVLARVLHVEPSTRHVSLSLRSHLLPPGGGVLDKYFSERLGEVVQGCKMTDLHYHSGALMKMPDGTTAFVHKNLMKEPNEEFNPNRLLSQPEHTLRIIDYSPVEQIHLATLRRSTIETTLFRYQDVKVGQIVEGKITGLQQHGVNVRITDHIRGMIPRTHLADVVLHNPEKRFFEGLKVKCRVLSVDAQNKRLILTKKKALVESTLPLFQSYSDARVGCISHGFIVCVKKFGCIVRFYEDVKGLVPVTELSTELVDNPESLFFVGQVVQAKVLNCDPENKKLCLSFKAVSEGDIKEAQTEKFDFVSGKTVSARVCRKVVDGLEVSIVPEEVPAFIPTMHLSDHVSNCIPLWTALEEGDTISNIMCLSKTKKKGITLTKKPLLKFYMEDDNIPQQFSELQVGMQMIGWVKNIMPYGVFVSFPHGLFGLAPKDAMADQFITNTSGIFEIGQTVVAKVTNLDEEKQRFLVSLKVSELSLLEEGSRARLFQGLKDRKDIFEMVTSRGESDVLQQLSAVSLGDKIKMTVGDTREDGSVTLSSDRLSKATVLASKFHTEGVNVTPGCKLSAVILHVDPLKSEVHVSLLPKLIKKKKLLTKDSKLSATIQYTDKDFAVISLGDTGHLTFIPLRAHVNNILDSKKCSVGSCLNVVVEDPSSEELGGLPLVAYQNSNAKHDETKSKSSGRSNDLILGEVMTVTVKKVKPTSVLVALPSGTTGNIHVSEIEESPAVGSFPTASLKIGTEVEARVIGGHTVRGNKFLPISHPNFGVSLTELSLLPRKLKDADEQSVDTMKKYTPGDDVLCYPSKYDEKTQTLEVHVKPNVIGTVELLAMITKPGQAKHPKNLFKPGQTVSAKVVSTGSIKSFQLSLSLTGMYKLEQGLVTMATVWKVTPFLGLLLKLPFGNWGFASVMDVSDAYADNPLEPYKRGQLVRCYITEETKNKKFKVSLRPSRLHKDQHKNVADPEIQSISDLKEGQIIKGYVKSINDKGVFVRLSRVIAGRVEFQHATKYFMDDPKVLSKHITLNALVTAKVLSVKAENSHVNLSLLSEDTGKPDLLPESLDLKLRLKGEKKAKHDKMVAKRRRALSESKQQENEKHEPKIKRKKVEACPVKGECTGETKTLKEKKKKKTKTEDSDSGVDVFFREKEETTSNKKSDQVKGKHEKTEPKRLQVTLGFPWESTLCSLTPFAAVDDTHESSEDEQEVKSKPVKKSRKELKQEQQNAEQQLSKLEAELMDTSVRPDSTTAFERLLLSSPDSSLLWLQYMAFHLQATEIEQARVVAERALKTISFREEQEKLNVWVAMLNLENMYGTQESLQKIFERATQYCEPLPVYQKLAEIYAKSDKIKEAESLYKNMVKRFRHEQAVYLSYGTFLLRQRQSDAANALLQRALQSLSNKEHVDLIAKFARLEFQYGNTERAKSMFDKVLSTYPKRTDLWSVFIDLLVKHGSQKEVREIFDRVIHLSVSVKKIKFFFKRYLEYEKTNGTPETIQAVKQKAIEYVESKGAEAAS
ncbi:protein RRP5 homolog [Ctenopharyngodon idella]|uniref:protein RRP5 homolog n=1 Tax=Ctenopharyngodon idella TaxID=7959 RepID=UPI0022313E9F|nr:protein RRP5 homolog [Ctenopharyngodon idella]XP_051723948.1 protein RRP5 homolog [Ctenopharyngodon idella]